VDPVERTMLCPGCGSIQPIGRPCVNCKCPVHPLEDLPSHPTIPCRHCGELTFAGHTCIVCGREPT